ncbi:MAG: hypothetical protein WB697_10435 [Stellaceae bacterium]
MAAAIRSSDTSVLASEFNDFLFAPIGEERNGMLLSVVSALARLSVDPWQEAANLAELPGATATHRLASLIATLPERPLTDLDPEANAARLIACLPRRVRSSATSFAASRSGTVPTILKSQPVRYGALILLMLLGGLGIAATEQSVARVHTADVPASATVISPTPSTSGQ